MQHIKFLFLGLETLNELHSMTTGEQQGKATNLCNGTAFISNLFLCFFFSKNNLHLKHMQSLPLKYNAVINATSDVNLNLSLF